MKKKQLAACIATTLGLALVAPAFAANTISNTTLSGGGFSYGGGVNLTNSTVTFTMKQDGSYGTMSVSSGDYVASGSTITLNTLLDAGGSTVAGQGSNRILIDGNASGTTTLAVKNNGGAGASTDLNGNTFNDAGEGISIAQVSKSSTPGAFALQNDYVAVGPYQYRLYAYAPGQSDANQRLVAADADGHWDYRLQNAKAAASPAPVAPVAPGAPAQPSAPVTRPGLVPQAASYLVHQNSLFAYGQQAIGALHRRMGEISGAHAREGNGELYVRAFGGDQRYASNLTTAQYGYGYDQQVKGLQIGGDWLKLDGEAGSLRVGAVASTGVSEVNPESVLGVQPTVMRNGKPMPIEIARARTHADSLAGTVTWAANGLYVDGLVGASRYRSDVSTPYRPGRTARLDSDDIFVSVEAGYGWAVNDLVTIEPQVQVSWQKLDTDRATDADGVVVDLGSPELFVWRVGARALFNPAVGPTGSALTHYLMLNYYDSTGPEQRAVLSGQRFVTGEYGHTAEAGYGLNASLKSGLSVHADAAWQRDIGHASRQGWVATAGLRWAF